MRSRANSLFFSKRRAVVLVLLCLAATGLFCAPTEREVVKKKATHSPHKLREAGTIREQIITHQKQSAWIDPETLERVERLNRKEALQTYRHLFEQRHLFDPAAQEEIHLYMAHLTLEKSLESYRTSMMDYEMEMAAYEAGDLDDEPELPTYDFVEAEHLYISFIESFPDSPGTEECLYNLANIEQKHGNDETATPYYRTLLARFPGSRLAPEVNLRLGEILFIENDFEGAQSYYQDVLAHGYSDYYEKALFKLGWCYYNMEDLDSAVVKFTQIAKSAPDPTDKGKGELYEESLEVLVKIFAEVGGVEALDQYAENIDRSETEMIILHDLGDLFKEQSRYYDAIETYEELLERYPHYENAPFVTKSLITAYLTDMKLQKAHKLQEDLLELYGRDSAWAKVNPDPDLDLPVDAIIEESLKDVILFYHRQGREARDSEAYAKALEMYPKYLDYFPEEFDAYEIGFFYAQSLFETERWMEAAEQFEIISKDPEHRVHREEASYHRILSIEEGDKDETYPDRIVTACLDFIELNPESDKNPLLLFKVGEVQFNNRRFDVAVSTFIWLLDAYPESEFFRPANFLIMESHFEEESYPEVEHWSRKIKSEFPDASPEEASRLDQLIILSMFKQAEEKERDGNHLAAAETFESLVDEFPGDKLSAQALYTAGLNYQQGGEEDRAIACYQRLIGAYGTSEYFSDSILLANPLYEKRNAWDEIEGNVDLLFRSDPSNEDARQALFSLAKILRKRGVPRRSVAVFDKYRARYPDDLARGLESTYQIAEIRQQGGLEAEALDTYRRLLDEHRSAQSAAGSLDFDDFKLAKAHFLLAEDTYRRYQAIRLVEPVEINWKRKEEHLDQVIKEYLETADYRYPEFSIPASFRIGEAYEDFGEALVTSDRPPGLSEEEREAYDELLDEKAYPYEEKAIETYELTLTKSEQAGVFNEWVGRAHQRLSLLAPWKHSPMEVEVITEVMRGSTALSDPALIASVHGGRPSELGPPGRAASAAEEVPTTEAGELASREEKHAKVFQVPIGEEKWELELLLLPIAEPGAEHKIPILTDIRQGEK